MDDITRKLAGPLIEEMGEKQFNAFRMIFDTLIGLTIGGMMVPSDSPAQDFFRREIGQIMVALAEKFGPEQTMAMMQMVSTFVDPLVAGAREAGRKAGNPFEAPNVNTEDPNIQ